MNMTSQEWRNLFKNKILLISVIAIILIPILYAAIFDKSVWDPYGRAKDLPVAVVNEDRPVKFMGKTLSIGDQVVKNLKSNHDLDWHFVTEEEASRGMKNLEYYMVITITEDFSKNAASIVSENPQKMEITYVTNESLNYIAQEISQVAATTLETQIREQVISAYVEAVVGAGGDAVSALSEAADGSGQLLNGVTEYTNGVSQASGGASQLSEGMSQLSGSVGPLISGVNQLNTGADQLSSALGKIDNSLKPLNNNMTTIKTDLNTLSIGVQDLSAALTKFENSLDPSVKETLSQEIQKIRHEIDEILNNKDFLHNVSNDMSIISTDAMGISQSLSNVSVTVGRIDSDMEAYLDGILSTTSMTPSEKNTVIAQIQQKVDQLIDHQVNEAQSAINTALTQIAIDASVLANKAQEISTASSDISQIADGIAISANNINTSIVAIEGGVNSLHNAIDKIPLGGGKTITSGLNNVSTGLNTAAKDLPLVLSGVDQLSNGSSQLSQGLGQMQNQMPALSGGISQLNSGSNQLTNGLTELDQDSSKLISGATQLAAALKEGAEAGAHLKVTQKNVEQFSAPTSLKLNPFSTVSNYGQALAPYIMSLALFVGCMLFNFVYPIRKISLSGQSSGSWWLSKVSLGFGVSSMMALVQATVMLLIGLPVYNIGDFYLTAFITAWAYMAITMFLAMTFDNPGRFIAMVLLVLQLGGAGGTFPVQLQGDFFQAIHPFLPMTYSVYAFRQAISGGIGMPLFIKSILILLSLAIIFVALLRYSMSILQKKHLAGISELDNNQELQALEK